MRTQGALVSKNTGENPEHRTDQGGKHPQITDLQKEPRQHYLERNGSQSSEDNMNENKTVFMIGLPTTTDQAYFSSWIRKEMPSLNFRQIKFPKSKQKGAFAFIEFEDESSRSKILELPHLLFNNRELKFQPYRTGEELQRYRETVQKRRLYVFGFKPTFTKKDLKSLFSKFGELDDAYIIKDRKTGRSKCFGYVIYKSVETATQVAAMSPLEHKGSSVRFKMHERRKRDQGFKSKGHKGKQVSQEGHRDFEHGQKKAKSQKVLNRRNQENQPDQAHLDYRPEIQFERAILRQQQLEYNQKRFFDPRYSLQQNQRMYRKFVDFHTLSPNNIAYYRRRGVMKHFEQNLVFRKPVDYQRTWDNDYPRDLLW